MTTSLELTLRRLILALLTFGLVAALAELFALGHYKELTQLIPIAASALTLGVIGWHAVSGGAASLRTLRLLMVAMLLVGVAGVLLHVRGSMAFQLDANPDLSGWALIYKVLHAKAPPAMAPGVMVQLGLLGLIYCYKHPGNK